MHPFAVILLLLLLGKTGSGVVHHVRRPGPLYKRSELPPSALPAPAPVTQAAMKQASIKHAAAEPPPWPQKMPAGLPPFPTGWEPDEPPPIAVQTRAMQLLPALWKRGAGTRKTEKTQGRWITYQAQAMGKKKGVVAFRIRPELLPSEGTEAPAAV